MLTGNLTGSLTGSLSGLMFTWKYSKTYLYMALLYDLGLTLGTGPATFTRASSQYVADNESLIRKIDAGVPAFSGMRPVKNLLRYSGDIANAEWVDFSGNVSDTNLLTLGFNGAYRMQSSGLGAGVVGKTFVFSAVLSNDTGQGSAAIRIFVNGTLVSTKQRISLTATPTRYSVKHTVVQGTTDLVTGVFGGFYKDLTNDISSYRVWSSQLEDVTGQTNQNPGDYVSTTTAPATKFFNYANPYTVDVNGVVTEGTHVAITGTKGVSFEPVSTNKCLCYGVPRADAYGSTLVSGTAVKGKVYEIVTRTSIDWSLIGTLLSGTANTVGAKYLITGVLTFTASDTGKEAIDYVGTKAYHDGTVFQNPITGMTLSGDVAGVLSIVTDQTALQAMTVDQLDRVVNAWKVYKLDNSLGSGSAYCAFGGNTGNVNPHSYSIVARMSTGAGAGRISDNAEVVYIDIISTNYTRVSTGNYIPGGTTRFLQFKAPAGSIAYFLLPQLEELPFATSIMPTEGATATRANAILSVPTASNITTSGVRHFSKIWTPRAVVAGRVETIMYSGVDASNYIGVFSNGTSIYMEKKVAGVSQAATRTITPVAGTEYLIDTYINADNTLNLKVNGVVAGTNTSTTTTPVLGTNLFIGSNGVTSIMGNIKDFKVTSA